MIILNEGITCEDVKKSDNYSICGCDSAGCSCDSDTILPEDSCGFHN